jgi:hypothetical protein
LFIIRAITEKYGTPFLLKAAFSNCDPGEEENMLLGLPYEGGKKKLPMGISKIIASLFTETNLK